jgi:hypothetical protein
MDIKDGIYYHIHNRMFAPDSWKIGNKILFCKEYYNFFFNYYVNVNLKKSNCALDIDTKLKEYTMLIRELIYEEVRNKYFPELPSRRHCAWLCDEDALELWKNTLGRDCDVYKVRATGNIHCCYAGGLDNDNINYNILFKKAFMYWKGECIGNPLEKEYLFEGEIEVLQKV